MPSDQFVLFYNEIFKFLEKKGLGELRKYYDCVAKRQAQFCLPMFAKGLKGIWEYRDRIRIEENCQSRNILGDNYLEGGQLVCPSLTKALKSATGACLHYCDHCPGWDLPVYTKAGYYCLDDIVSRTLPTCYMFVTKDRDLMEAKFNERLAMSGADLVFTNHPIGMVHGVLADSEKYEALHPRFGKAFAFLRSHDLAKLPLGRNEIDGDDIYANVMDVTLKTWDSEAKLEVHRQYFDIHVPITGDEVNGFVYDAEHSKADNFNVADDYVLFQNPKMAKFAVKKGEFVIFYPNGGAHAPNKTEVVPCKHRKLVVKVRA